MRNGNRSPAPSSVDENGSATSFKIAQLIEKILKDTRSKATSEPKDNQQSNQLVRVREIFLKREIISQNDRKVAVVYG